jgi:hypothetical protein
MAAAAMIYLETLSHTSNNASASTAHAEVRKFIRKNRAVLSADAQTWGGAGFALLNVGDYTRCVKWMGDWRERSDTDRGCYGIFRLHCARWGATQRRMQSTATR